MRLLVGIFILVVLALGVNAECASLNDDSVLSGLVFACNDTYSMSKGVIIEGNESLLDCKGAVLKGSGKEGVGVVVRDELVRVRNCVFQDLKIGIVVNGSKPRIQMNQFINNTVGIETNRLSKGVIQNNTFEGNNADVSEGTFDYSPVVKKVEPPVENETKKVVPPPITGGAAVPIPTEVNRIVTVMKWFAGGLVLLGFVVFVFAEVRRLAVQDPDKPRRKEGTDP